MAKKVIRMRLDLPRKVYHKSKAEVEKRRAQDDPEIKTLSDLVTVALEKYIRGEQR